MQEKATYWYNKKYFGFLNLERLLWIALIGFGLFYYFRYQTVTEIETADIQVIDSNGSNVSLNQLIGDKPTVVHFYASWCGPCLKELPALSEFAVSDEGRQLRKTQCLSKALWNEHISSSSVKRTWNSFHSSYIYIQQLKIGILSSWTIALG
jgi:AhpC/TSA family